MSEPTRQKAAGALGPATPEAPTSSEDHSGLEMDREQMLQLANQVAELLVARWENLPGEGAWEGDFVESLRDQLLKPPPEDGRPAGEVLHKAAREIMPIAARIDHPRFFGFIPSSPTWPGVLADFLVAGHQVNQCTWLTSSGPSQLELVVIDWIRQWVGYPESAGGLLTSGGSVATITALVAAREAAVRDRKPTVYMSDQSHSAQIRAARIVGVESEHVRLVASDRRFRLDMDALAQAVAADRAAGLNPIAVCANAGAGSTGSIDPLPEIADFCGAEGIWLHVDAAYGGFAAVTEQGRKLLRGMERADSIGLDAHKWFFQPYEAGCLMVKDVNTLSRAFAVPHDMLQDTIWGAGHPNFSDRGPQLSRAVRALKIWVSVRTFGMRAFRRAISKGMELAARAEDYVHASPMLEMLNPTSLGIVCFRVNPTGADLGESALEDINREVLAGIFWGNPAFISSTLLHGTFSLRLCILNHTTTWKDVRETLEAIERSGSAAAETHRAKA